MRTLFQRRLLFGALVTLLAVGGVAGCGEESEKSTAGGSTQEGGAALVVYSGRNEALVGPILQDLEKVTGLEVEVRYGDSAELAAQILEEGDRTKADVFFSQDAGALGALAKAGRLDAMPRAILDRVPARYRAKDGTWVGVSGRVRVIAYDPQQVAQVPQSVFELTDPKWKGKVGYAPTNASFQAFVTAMRVASGEERAKQWLQDMKANDIRPYEKNTDVLNAVDRGEVALGLINHYYWFEKVAELGQDKVRARIGFLRNGDPGALVNVAGVGVLEGSDRAKAADKAVDYLLGPQAQKYFADETKEYPLVAGVPTAEGLPPFDPLQGPDMDLSELDSLDKTLALLQEVGLT
jgi:iron(III) transport system substrate-binding protein